MAQRFFNPLAQFVDSTGLPRSGGLLFFYESGTSTKLDTYSDAALSSANSNPVVLNSAGQLPNAVFLKNQDYKVVLAPSTDTDPPASAIWTEDPVRSSDFVTRGELLVGSGSPTGNVAGTAGSSGVLPTQYWDYTNSILYFCTTTGSASTAVWTAVNASASTPSVPRPQGRVTLVSETPVIVSDQASKTTVYYTPYEGNLIPIYGGTSFTPTEFSELSLSLVASHAANAIYDLFVWSESGVVTFGTGPAWTAAGSGAGARGTGASTTELTRIAGLLVNAVQMTTRNGNTTYTVNANRGTYVGSIFMDASAGQVTCHVAYGQARKFGVWNMYNRVPIILKAGYSTATWTYTTGSYRVLNADAANKIQYFAGYPEEMIDIVYRQHFTVSASINAAGFAIGWDSTNAASGMIQNALSGNSDGLRGDSRFIQVPTLGMVDVNMLELGESGITMRGGEDDCLMIMRYRG